MHLTLFLLSIPVIAVAGLLWFLADIKFAQQWGLKRAELGAQDKWRELNAHFESGLKSRRPMLLLFQRLAIPGTLEAEYALHLSNQGEHERALVLAQKASRISAKRPAVHIAILPAQATILQRLGRYEEAKEVVRLGRTVLASPALAEFAKTDPNLGVGIVLQEALIELSLGHLDPALRLGVEASAGTISDPARALISGVLTAKGRFKEALEALVYQPSDFYTFLATMPPLFESQEETPLDLLAEDKLLQQTVEKANEELSSVFGPAIDLGRALVFLEAGDAANLGVALANTETKLKSHQIMEHIFVRTRACWHAMTGNLPGVDADLARARQLAADTRASRSVKYETQLAVGRARFLLAQHNRAIDELKAANKLALHPIEKHTSTYWLARASHAANSSSAESLFKSVTADGFQTWMEADARVRLGQATT
jgi:tetratricopeptide (TPR) repeat protein